MFPLVAVHVMYNDQEHRRTRGGLLNSAPLGCLKLLCLPQPAMSNGCSQEGRVVIQYGFSAKCTVPWLRNTGQSAEVSKCQVGFSTALFWCSFPLALRSRNAWLPPHVRKVRRDGFSVWMGSPPPPPPGPLDLRSQKPHVDALNQGSLHSPEAEGGGDLKILLCRPLY